jgi:hypothetical protein
MPGGCEGAGGGGQSVHRASLLRVPPADANADAAAAAGARVSQGSHNWAACAAVHNVPGLPHCVHCAHCSGHLQPLVPNVSDTTGRQQHTQGGLSGLLVRAPWGGEGGTPRGGGDVCTMCSLPWISSSIVVDCIKHCLQAAAHTGRPRAYSMVQGREGGREGGFQGGFKGACCCCCCCCCCCWSM